MQDPIWPGSGSAVSGNTPFGFYDDDSTFQTEAPKFATWAAKRLGFPIMSVELQDSSFILVWKSLLLNIVHKSISSILKTIC